eukprot:m.193335 g.193335  ORF g.193335 m.193335 type:complete len:718 (+) comp15666_c0_seq8:155-2308(+)
MVYLYLCGILCLVATCRATGFKVSSKDGQMEVTVGDSGINQITVGGYPLDMSGDITIANCSISMSKSSQQGSVVLVTQALTCPGDNKAETILTLSPEEDHVLMSVSFKGTSANNWTSAVSASFGFDRASSYKLWAPWDRGTKDALNPSDGGFSWWEGTYAFGWHADDFVVAEHVSVLVPEQDKSFSIIGNASNPPVPEGHLYTHGDGGAGCTAPGACSDNASFNFEFLMLRMGPGVTHMREYHLVPHSASCWRPGILWSTENYHSHWGPTFANARYVDGLGSYSSYLGNLTDPIYKQMGYQTSWDLSGRFFPYMGQFLPPMNSSQDTWMNDKEGTQQPANCSYQSIDDYYCRIQKESFSTLSYYNVFEYGINIVYSPDRGAPSFPLKEQNWENASQYLQDNFRPALVTNYACAYGGPCRASFENPVIGKAQGSWQGSVVVDPRAGLGYDNSLVSQVKRKISVLPHFQGLVVDRSDWNQLVNLDGDDGYTFVVNRSGHSMQRSYKYILGKVRSVLNADKGKEKVMLCNTVGYAWLPNMDVFDGSYSEGGSINAVGILGVMSTSILWVYGKDCCSDDWFQQHIRMGVFPMAPFPMNDHAIQPTSENIPAYIKYGKIFTALRKCNWILTPHPITVTSANTALTNAFSKDGIHIFPVVMGNTSSVNVLVSALPNSSSDSLAVSYLVPGNTSNWEPLQYSMQGSQLKTTIPLSDGCALLKIQ